MSLSYRIAGKRCLALICLIVMLATAGRAPAETSEPFQTLTVMGKSIIHGDNAAAARNQAIADSLDVALHQVLMSKLAPDDLLRHFSKINEIMYDRTDRFVQDFKVLTETKTGRVYRVLLEATVSIVALQEQLSTAGILLGRKELPRVLLMVAEQKIGEISPQYWWGGHADFFENFSERAAAAALGEKGFAIVDPTLAIQSAEPGDEYRKFELTDAELIHLGLYSRADVVVVGLSTVQQTANTMGTDTRSFKAAATVRAIRVDTGQEVASLSQSAVSVHTDEFEGGRNALAAVGTLLGQALASQVASAWQKTESRPMLITLVITGARQLKNVEMFRRSLSGMSGVNEVQMLEMTSDEHMLLVDYQSDGPALASALMLNTFDAFGINIYEIHQDNLKIELAPQ